MTMYDFLDSLIGNKVVVDVNQGMARVEGELSEIADGVYRVSYSDGEYTFIVTFSKEEVVSISKKKNSELWIIDIFADNCEDVHKYHYKVVSFLSPNIVAVGRVDAGLARKGIFKIHGGNNFVKAKQVVAYHDVGDDKLRAFGVVK